MSEQDDLERRLRAALSAKAEQITDADLDLGREADVAEQLRTASHPRRRIYAGAGIAAAAAAIIGVGALAIHPGGQTPVNAASHFTTPANARSTATVGGTGTAQPQMTQRANTAGGPSALSHLPTETSSATATGSSSRATVHGTGMSRTSLGSATSASAPPVMPTDLPQAGPLGDGKYAGPVPIADASGGPTRMLNMPDGTKWQVLSRTDKSLTVRITDLPTDIEAYWSKTLPGLGWVQAGGGWQFPRTSYAVSAISDKAAFTVSW